ncbi:hypothetical protein ABPG75_007467 [Micractinium tetrahymenae]
MRHTKAHRRRATLQFGAFRCAVLALMSAKALLLVGQEMWLWACAAVDVMQAAIGCWCHHLIAPSRAGIWPAASLFYLLGGSAVLWSHFYCPGLLTAYRTLAALLRWACGPELSQLLVLTARGTDAAAAAAGMADSSHDVRRCMSGQAVVLLLPVFVGATFATYRRELDERRAFLAAAREASPQREIRAELRSAAAASPLDFASFAVPALAAMYIYGVP